MSLESYTSGVDGGEVFEFGRFRVDTRQRKLLSSGQPVAMTAKVFDTLAFLVQRHGKVVDKAELMQAIWPDTAVEEGNLHHYVSTVRKVLGEKPGEHRFIATVPGADTRLSRRCDGSPRKKSHFRKPEPLPP